MISNVTDEQLVKLLTDAIAPRTSRGMGSMDLYHCLLSDDDAEIVPDERLACIGGPDGDEFYSVPFDLHRLREGLKRLLGENAGEQVATAAFSMPADAIADPNRVKAREVYLNGSIHACDAGPLEDAVRSFLRDCVQDRTHVDDDELLVREHAIQPLIPGGETQGEWFEVDLAPFAADRP